MWHPTRIEQERVRRPTLQVAAKGADLRGVDGQVSFSG